MKLYDYIKLMPEGEELTVWDKDYDMEAYFYGGQPDDAWDKSICELSKLLTIKEIRNAGVIVNLSNIIEKKIDKLEEAEMFYKCNIDAIMDCMSDTIAGNVGEAWMEEFVNILKG